MARLEPAEDECSGRLAGLSSDGAPVLSLADRVCCGARPPDCCCRHSLAACVLFELYA